MSNMGIATRKDFFLITRRHLPFLFNKRYKSLYRGGLLCYVNNINYVIILHQKDFPVRDTWNPAFLQSHRKRCVLTTTFYASLLAHKQTFLDPSSQGTGMTKKGALE
jgi:hypothetical protein